jgi:16S rRNA (guanine1516-N2)-methyltransferase
VSLSVDFVSGAQAHRRKYGGGKSQLIAKAAGIKPGLFPSILFQALHEGMQRAYEHGQKEDADLLVILARMRLLNCDGLDFLNNATNITQQVIYLDPMFPERKKSAAVKKDMVLLQKIVGPDDDNNSLFQRAFSTDVCRIVVKRPKLAPSLGDIKPALVFQGQSSRFDVYPKKTIT